MKQKTPMQELIEVLKIHRDTAFEKSRMYESEHYHSRGQAFNDAISFAELQLEKEKEVMCEFAEEYVGSCLIDYPKIKIIFDQTFNN
mgnify:CR=1 FL=1